MTTKRTKEIFETIADCMEMTIEEVISLYKSGDKAIVRLVKLGTEVF